MDEDTHDGLSGLLLRLLVFLAGCFGCTVMTDRERDEINGMVRKERRGAEQDLAQRSAEHEEEQRLAQETIDVLFADIERLQEVIKQERRTQRRLQRELAHCERLSKDKDRHHAFMKSMWDTTYKLQAHTLNMHQKHIDELQAVRDQQARELRETKQRATSLERRVRALSSPRVLSMPSSFANERALESVRAPGERSNIIEVDFFNRVFRGTAGTSLLHRRGRRPITFMIDKYTRRDMHQLCDRHRQNSDEIAVLSIRVYKQLMDLYAAGYDIRVMDRQGQHRDVTFNPFGFKELPSSS